MVQIRWENIPEKTQTFSCQQSIELLQCDKYFLKKMKICPLGDLIHAHHGTINVNVCAEIHFQMKIHFSSNTIFKHITHF